jgi:hypothetical protein
MVPALGLAPPSALQASSTNRSAAFDRSIDSRDRRALRLVDFVAMPESIAPAPPAPGCSREGPKAFGAPPCPRSLRSHRSPAARAGHSVDRPGHPPAASPAATQTTTARGYGRARLRAHSHAVLAALRSSRRRLQRWPGLRSLGRAGLAGENPPARLAAGRSRLRRGRAATPPARLHRSLRSLARPCGRPCSPPLRGAAADAAAKATATATAKAPVKDG